MTRTALVSGASIAGLATAFWLARSGWRVEVLERAPAFRDGGQNVDIRGAAHEVVERMGLTERVRERTTTEEGTSFIDERGRVIGEFPVEEQDGPTAELEILRGDLARLILEELPVGAEVTYGDRIAAVRDRGSGVSAAFESGREADYDLLIVAEGVKSPTRDLVFGPVPRRELGLNMAYGTIERTADDDRWWRWYAAPGRRGLTLRPDQVGTTRATLAVVDEERDLSELPVEAAKRELAEVFADAGWESRRVTQGFLASDDVYVDYLTQITMPAWSAGRVVVTGDAAWCVTPLGGGGTSLALTGGYVLAAYLSASPDDPADALAAYERWMRPLIDDSQKLPPGTPKAFYPESRAGVAVLRTVYRIMTRKPLRRLGSTFSRVAGTDQQLPDIRLA